MDIVLIALVALLVGGFLLGFYMDWFGLWMSKEELSEQIDRAKERMRGMEEKKTP